MHLKSVRIQNFKCYDDSGLVEFDPEMTCVVGTNDSGKTALLHAIRAGFAKEPYRGAAASKTDSDSVVHLQLVASPSDLAEAARRGKPTWCPIGESGEPSEAAKTINKHWLKRGLVVSATITSSSLVAWFPELSEDPNSTRCVELVYSGGAAHANAVVQNISPSASAPAILVQMYRECVRYSAAERPVKASASFSASVALAHDASNLPSVLNRLQTSERESFRRLEKYVRQVFGHIESVESRSGDSEALAVVSSVKPELDRPELAVSLADSGTGVGHALGILINVITARTPSTILLDEPQSHLHPLAVRRLFAVLRAHPTRHQYVVSTHSPAVIAAAQPGSIVRVSKTEVGSRVENADPGNRQNLRLVLQDVGALVSDVFGADRVLWVEGESEERCFPLIIDKFIGSSARTGLEVLRMWTGDLKRRDAAKVLDVYHRLSGSWAMRPPVVAFILDGEHEGGFRDDPPSTLRFLPARMFENYLLDPHALAAVFSELDNFADPPPDAEIVAKWLTDALADPTYWHGPVPQSVSIEEVQRDLNGAKVLNAAFSELSEARHVFRKPEHVVALTQAVIRLVPDRLRPVGEFIRSALDGARTTPSA